MKTHLVRALAWLALAVLVTWPTASTLSTRLLGNPDVDVWNHAWGWWWFAEALSQGELPYRTELLGWPDGGTLYFIDPLGALAGLPLTWTLGPVVAFNVVLLLRVAATGLFTQSLTEELAEGRTAPTAARWGGWLAGAAAASAPYLLCELHNAITEMCTLHWVALTLWLSARAVRRGSWGRWAMAGLALGLTAVGTFYFGLATGLVLVGLVLGRGLSAPSGDRARLLCQAAAAAAVALVVATPAIWAFHGSLGASDALIDRGMGHSDFLRSHNAVDPRTFLWPGHFMSVDLHALGQRFLHTGYLRWTVLPLALLAAVRVRRTRLWVGLALLSLLLGLGERLFFDGSFVAPLALDGRQISLPFAWLMSAFPSLSVTHPLRLSAVAQVLVPALAGVGLAALGARAARLAPLLAGLAIAETLFASTATWPLPTARARVPVHLATLPEGPVLDLPTEVGATMASCRHLWFQTRHGQPLPFRPDVRLVRTSDPRLVPLLSPRGTGVAREGIRRLNERHAEFLKQDYAAIVVHTDLERAADLPVSYETLLTPWFGEPERKGAQLVWRLR